MPPRRAETVRVRLRTGPIVRKRRSTSAPTNPTAPYAAVLRRGHLVSLGSSTGVAFALRITEGKVRLRISRVMRHHWCNEDVFVAVAKTYAETTTKKDEFHSFRVR